MNYQTIKLEKYDRIHQHHNDDQYVNKHKNYIDHKYFDA